MTLHSDDFTPAFPISPLVLVGVCAAGKSTLAHNLDLRGIAAKPVAQEHSLVAELYRRTGSWVVVLAANWDTVHHRRVLAWNPDFYRDEWDRIAGARRHASLIVHTDCLNPIEVADSVTQWFDRRFGFQALWRTQRDLSEGDRAAIRSQFRPDRVHP